MGYASYVLWKLNGGMWRPKIRAGIFLDDLYKRSYVHHSEGADNTLREER